MANLYNGIHNYCKEGEIVMLLDGDDSFIGRQVLSTFNAIYQRGRNAVVYSTYMIIT